jgi:putative nucleotidyltransferase with HDIG domain
MLVHIIADKSGKSSQLRSMIEPQHSVSCAALAAGACVDKECSVAIIAADLRNVDNIAALKDICGKLKNARRRIFVTDQRERRDAVQAYALGATHVLSNPVTPRSLLAAIAEGMSASNAPMESDAGSSRGAASGGAVALASMFSAVLEGNPIDVAVARSAASGIADSISEHGLSDWLGTVRRHHEGTYQHCLLVTGVAVDFGLSLGLPRADIERLHSAAMFHDIGKAKIPLAVLDKPGRLDPEERAMIETHPAVGYDVLKDTAGISHEILDAVRHHHEFLDGSGYPDGLCAASISDVVRILTISDIFAALVEDRRYKPRMPRDQAYEIIRSMHGKLEGPLVAAFRPVALNR